MIVSARRAGLRISKTANLREFLCKTYLEFNENGQKRQEFQWAVISWWRKRSGENGQSNGWNGNSSSNNPSLQKSCAEENLWWRNTSNHEADELQQQETCWVSLLSDKNKKLRLQFASDHKKLDNSRLAKFCLIWSGLNFDFLCDIRAKVWCGQQECRDLYCLVSIVQSASSSSGDVIVSGIYSGSIEWKNV